MELVVDEPVHPFASIIQRYDEAPATAGTEKVNSVPEQRLDGFAIVSG
jgi:hypothetical protein